MSAILFRPSLVRSVLRLGRRGGAFPELSRTNSLVPSTNTLETPATHFNSRHLSTTGFRLEKKEEGNGAELEKPAAEEAEELEEENGKEGGGGFDRARRGDDDGVRDPKDRTRVIPVELSLKYMESAAYKTTYGDSKIWELYRRNFAKGRTNRPTRKKCVRHGMISTGNPCPICRDEYLVVDYRNVRLLQQFLTDYNGQMLTSKKTGVCQEQWLRLRVEMEKAKDHGYLNVDPPFVEYDYEQYKPRTDKV